jgi:hypothetical protein
MKEDLQNQRRSSQQGRLYLLGLGRIYLDRIVKDKLWRMIERKFRQMMNLSHNTLLLIYHSVALLGGKAKLFVHLRESDIHVIIAA